MAIQLSTHIMPIMMKITSLTQKILGRLGHNMIFLELRLQYSQIPVIILNAMEVS